MITYNHEQYIAQAIEGVIKQQGNFNLKLYIGEDQSSDGTRRICDEYANKYSNNIILLPSDKRYGMMDNFIRTLKECNGDYLALCDGDDYWTDTLKLDRQITFLEQNLDYSICFHRVNFLYSDGSIKEEENKSSNEETYTIENLASKNFIHTSSVLYRNLFFKNLPNWFSQSSVGDYVLHMLNANHGKIKYLPKSMAVYRFHEQGIWSHLKIDKARSSWIKLLDNLIAENFSQEVVEKLKFQKQNTVESYLRFLLANDIVSFKENFKKYLHQNAIDRDKWLLIFFPERVANLECRLSEIKGYWFFRAYKKIHNLFHKNHQK